MDAVLFLAADFVNYEASGKLNVLGIFNQIVAKEFPAKHRRLYLVVRLVAQLGEFQTQHDFKIAFFDEDGHELGGQQQKIEVPRPERGKQATLDLIVEVNDLLLPAPGRYEFKLIVNRDVKGSVPIDVIQATPSSG